MCLGDIPCHLSGDFVNILVAMKYTDFNSDAPRLQLGQIVNEANGSWDLQFKVITGKTVAEEGVCRTIGISSLDEVDVDDKGFATNCKLNRDHKYLVKTGYKPDTTGLGPQK
jgi:hypothetical protein